MIIFEFIQRSKNFGARFLHFAFHAENCRENLIDADSTAVADLLCSALGAALIGGPSISETHKGIALFTGLVLPAGIGGALSARLHLQFPVPGCKTLLLYTWGDFRFLWLFRKYEVVALGALVELSAISGGERLWCAFSESAAGLVFEMGAHC